MILYNNNKSQKDNNNNSKSFIAYYGSQLQVHSLGSITLET